jgi:Protein NO VEIN, C-terminal
MMVRSTWLTAARTRRLAHILTAVPARSPGLAVDEARLRLWRMCGGPIDDVPTLIDVLIGTELITADRAALRLTRAGQKVLAKRGAEGMRPLGLALLRAGYLHDQARTLLDMSATEDDGRLSCPTRSARQRCPQLLGLLQFWPDVAVGPRIGIPVHLVRELETVWALLPPPSADDAARDALRKNIGNRGELYSYQLERLSAADQSHIVWVARDDPHLGYDIEDRSVDPRRRIEVKASGDTPIRFLLSDNEWQKAHQNPSSYEIHFWGGIDLNVDPAEEYARLRSQDYPRIFIDLPGLVSTGEFAVQPTKWRLEKNP